MKKLFAIALLSAAPAFAGTPEHFFDSLALHPNAPQATVPTVPPPPALAVFDPTPIIAAVGPVIDTQGKWTTWAQKAIMDVGAKLDAISADEALEVGDVLNIKNQISNLQTQIAAIPAGAKGDQGIPGIAGPPGPSGLSANTPAYDAAGLTNVILATQGGNFCWPNNRLGNLSRGATADRAATISAGTHTFSVCVASNNTGISMHAEIPAGTNVTGTINVPNTGGWTGGNYVWVSTPITLTSPATSVHLVFDTGGLDFGGFSVQ